MITARSTSTRLPWEGSPHPSMPPSVTPSEGSSKSEDPGEIQPTATPNEGSSTSEHPTGIQSTATTSDDSKIVVTTQPSPNSSLLSIITGRNDESFTTGSDTDGFSQSEGQSETQTSLTVTPDTLR